MGKRLSSESGRTAFADAAERSVETSGGNLRGAAPPKVAGLRLELMPITRLSHCGNVNLEPTLSAVCRSRAFGYG
jgi:hypothetical protein